MTFGGSIERKTHRLEEYVGQWIDFRISEKKYIGVLEEIDEKRGYVILSPYVDFTYPIGKLPQRPMISEGHELVVYDGFHYSVKVRDKKVIDEYIVQAEKEYQLATMERELAEKKVREELKKFDKE